MFSLAWGRCCDGGSDGICVGALQILAPIAAVSSRALWQFGRGRGELESRHMVSSIAAVAGAPDRSLRTSSIPRRAAHAWDDASRLPIAFGSLASLEPSSH